jgi:anion-transporting  ArsA/GET3 family ATPase
MEVTGFLRRSNIVVVVGKGGVGKTTAAAALASLAADAGLDVLVVALDDASGLAALFGYEGQLGYDEVVVRQPNGPDGNPTAADGSLASAGVPGRVRARVLTSDAALLEYLGTHGLGRFAGRLVRTGALDVVATAIPGIREVLILGKVRQLEEAGAADLIILDAPATGHALRFLSSSGGLADAARGGPLRAQADQVVAMLTDPARCQVVLVTIPEETPVNEAVETAFRLEAEVGVALGPVIVNCCYPLLAHLDEDPARAAAAAGLPPIPPGVADSLARAAAFRRARQELQLAQRARLAERLPLDELELPYLFTAELGATELGRLVSELATGIAALP